MRKILAVSAVAIFVLTSCLKGDSKCDFTDSKVVAPATEVMALQDSLTTHGIMATQHSSGIFYTINSQGNGKQISNLCTSLAVEYKGGFFNGKTFDSTVAGSNSVFQLGRVITGWQKGVPLISEGGDITLYIPPSLAYGPYPINDQRTGVEVIPANSYLVFRVHVVAIQ